VGQEVRSGSEFRLRNVRVAYGANVALDVEDLSIGSGEAVAVVGPSGAGKTTLLRALGAALRPTAGDVSIDGERLDSLSNSELQRVRAGIGFVHQDLSLVPNLRVIQNLICGRLGRLSFLGSLRGMLFPSKQHVDLAHSILERVGIAEKMYEHTDRLSGGQRQRVAIARALFQEPNILLADEPVSSVDPARARDTVDLLTGISRERGLTLCASLHDVELAREFFPRLVGLRHGRVVFDRAADQVGSEELRSLYKLASEELLSAGD
jgi:phosphonate transport system ATP-binding protein